MDLRVIGCHGGETPKHRTSAFVVDERIAIDAGALTSGMELDAQCALEAVLVFRPRWPLPQPPVASRSRPAPSRTAFTAFAPTRREMPEVKRAIPARPASRPTVRPATSMTTMIEASLTTLLCCVTDATIGPAVRLAI